MNKFLPIQFKFNVCDFLKLSLLALFVLLLLGCYAQVNAEPAPKDEVISVPPQQAFFIQKRTHATSGGYDSGSQHRNTSGRVSNNRKNEQNLAKKANSGIRTDYNPR